MIATERLTPGQVSRAGALLAAGQLVVIPTETVYGLAASARDAAAVEGIFHAKGRPADNPLIVHFSDTEEIVPLLPGCSLGTIDRSVVRLVEAFMPGPLTLVVHAPGWVPPVLNGGLSSIAVRIPSHPLARSIIRAAGVPLAAPSANLSGRPSPTTFRMAWSEMAGRVSAVLDGGECGIGIESTVVDVREAGHFFVLRPGRISLEQIRETAGGGTEVVTAQVPSEHSPGTRYRHYTPDVPVILVPPESWNALEQELAAELAGDKGAAAGRFACYRLGVPPRKLFNSSSSEPVVRYAPSLAEFTQGLYRFLWESEQQGAHVLFVEEVSSALAEGVHDRLARAATERWRPGMLGRFR